MRTNVEIVRGFFAAFEERDGARLIADCAPDVVWEPVTAAIHSGGQPYRGHEGMQRYLDDVARVWQELRPMPEAYFERDGGVVAATGRISAWGAGRVIDAPAGWVFRIERGLLAYGATYGTPAQALAAAGIAVGDAPA